MNQPTQTVNGMLDSVMPGKNGIKADGQPYQIYELTMAGIKYTTFVKTLYEQAYAYWQTKTPVNMEVYAKGNYWNVKSISPVVNGTTPAAPNVPTQPTPAAPVPPPTQAPQVNSKDLYWKNKEVLDAERDKRISRHGAFNTAIEMYKLNHNVEEATTTEQLHQEITATAEQILKWIKDQEENTP